MTLSQFYFSKIQYPLQKHQFQSKSNSFVYVVFNRNNELFKIGITQNPYERVRTIQSSSGSTVLDILQIEVQCNYDESSLTIEKALHLYYKDKRVIGEYFSLSISDILEIEDLFLTIEGEDMLFFERNLIPELLPYIGYW